MFKKLNLLYYGFKNHAKNYFRAVAITFATNHFIYLLAL